MYSHWSGWALGGPRPLWPHTTRQVTKLQNSPTRCVPEEVQLIPQKEHSALLFSTHFTTNSLIQETFTDHLPTRDTLCSMPGFQHHWHSGLDNFVGRGAVLCIAGCQTASLPSTLLTPVAPIPVPVVMSKNVSRCCQMSLWGQNHFQLGTTVLCQDRDSQTLVNTSLKMLV